MQCLVLGLAVPATTAAGDVTTGTRAVVGATVATDAGAAAPRNVRGRGNRNCASDFANPLEQTLVSVRTFELFIPNVSLPKSGLLFVSDDSNSNLTERV